MPKSRTLPTPNAGEDMEQQTLSFIADGNASAPTTLEDRVFVTTLPLFLPKDPAITLL
jgi:hypothetical protein